VAGGHGVALALHYKHSALRRPQNDRRGAEERHAWAEEAASLTEVPDMSQKGTRLGN
jgi:hypothetical protein